MKLSKSKLNQIIKEESRKVLAEGYESYSSMVVKLKKKLAENDVDLFEEPGEAHPAEAQDDELKDISMDIANLLELAEELHKKLEGMGRRYGELAHTGTYARMVKKAADALSTRYHNGLDNLAGNPSYSSSSQMGENTTPDEDTTQDYVHPRGYNKS